MMKHKRLVTSLLTSLAIVTTLPISATVFQAPVVAKTTAKATVISKIKKTPDLNPTSSVRSFSSSTYQRYQSTFNKEYNVDQMSLTGVFRQHHAWVYTASPQLRKYLTVSMKTWNHALGSAVFKTGTSHHYTIRVGFGTGGKDGSLWDGLYKTNKLWINKSHFYSNDYILTVLGAVSGRKVTKAKTAADKAAYQNYYRKFWEATITHELGHSLGLDHSPYQDDIMYAQSGERSGSIKYSWTTAKKGNGTFAGFTNVLSERDVNRAKLTKLLGYW
ncbi:matrixin family metalloprotease [Lentilactobacillus raoultii]|uniref:Matrixin family metalloprotease n=1 Tax=Lentilactobacillus raoultii TaxID=1987503 RepID=A0ABW3PJ24_9LACO|nr:M57 family metalloprotease [Lentilactobacillus raoultii]